MMDKKAQKLVDLCFDIALTMSDDRYLREKDTEFKAKWIAQKLRECGFKTHPQGASWGVLDLDSWEE